MKIWKLTGIIDELASHTAGALTAINQELLATRATVMQNRLALDIILAKEGGVWKVINAKECCIYIPDNFKLIQAHITNISNLTETLHELKTTDFWEVIGSLGKRIENGLRA